jgi:hypothetical protein
LQPARRMRQPQAKGPSAGSVRMTQHGPFDELVGKLFPTVNPDHVEPLRTANFFTQQDIGGDTTDRRLVFDDAVVSYQLGKAVKESGLAGRVGAHERGDCRRQSDRDWLRAKAAEAREGYVFEAQARIEIEPTAGSLTSACSTASSASREYMALSRSYT